jgi:hypothetical protein
MAFRGSKKILEEELILLSFDLPQVAHELLWYSL